MKKKSKVFNKDTIKSIVACICLIFVFLIIVSVFLYWIQYVFLGINPPHLLFFSSIERLAVGIVGTIILILTAGPFIIED